MKKKQKVLLFCLDSISNAGEDILGTTTEYLIKNSCDDVIVERKQLLPSWRTFSFCFKLMAIFSKLIFLLAEWFSKGDIQYRLLHFSYKAKYSHYYARIIKGADRIVFSVGMFKYSTQNFSYIYDLILTIASKYNKDVMISAASVERYNCHDWRSRQLHRVLNYESLKVFTTRDGLKGLERLKTYGIPDKLRIEAVGDPALWIQDVYSLKGMQKAKKAIGVNVIRPDIFLDYGGKLLSEQLIDFYIQTIKSIEQKGFDWFLFCDGMNCDYKVGLLLLQKLNLPNERLLPPLKTGEQLMQVISSCQGVVASRFHACLTSYALHVPFVGFIWDDKIRFFSETSGMQDYFLDESNLAGEKMVGLLEKSLGSHPDFEILNEMKQKTKETIGAFVNS